MAVLMPSLKETNPPNCVAPRSGGFFFVQMDLLFPLPTGIIAYDMQNGHVLHRFMHVPVIGAVYKTAFFKILIYFIL